jgi:mono/diheme cytochrome c family protein
MRRRRARLLAIATGAAVLALAMTFALLRRSTTSMPEGASVHAGARVYEELGCAGCHSLRGAGNASRPLDGVGRRLSREAIRTWIVAPEQMDPGVRKPSYDRVPKEDVDALVEYLRAS